MAMVVNVSQTIMVINALRTWQWFSTHLKLSWLSTLSTHDHDCQPISNYYGCQRSPHMTMIVNPSQIIMFINALHTWPWFSIHLKLLWLSTLSAHDYGCQPITNHYGCQRSPHMTMVVNPSQIIMVVNALRTWPWLSTHLKLLWLSTLSAHDHGFQPISNYHVYKRFPHMTMVVNPSQIIMVVNALRTWPWLSTHLKLLWLSTLSAHDHGCQPISNYYGCQRSPHMTMVVNPSQIIMVINAFHTWQWLSTHLKLPCL